MVKQFLITRPYHEVPITYLHEFSKSAIKEAKGRKEIHVINLEGSNATRDRFEKEAKKMDDGLIFLNGHGTKESVWGHEDEPLLDMKNTGAVRKKIIYALACDSLQQLGTYAVTAGAQAYVGYRSSFMLVTDRSRDTSPGKDKNALPFRKACETLIHSLLIGETVKKAIEKTKNEYRHSIKFYGSSEDPHGIAPLIRFALAWDLEYLDMEGNPESAF